MKADTELASSYLVHDCGSLKGATYTLHVFPHQANLSGNTLIGTQMCVFLEIRNPPKLAINPHSGDQ